MSTNKTEHHSLHLWEPGDHFLRTEFNENNEVIDQALCWHKLGTAEADGTDYFLCAPVDGEALLQCGKIEVSVFCPVPANLYLTVNGTDSGYRRVEDLGYWYREAYGNNDMGLVCAKNITYAGRGFSLSRPLRGVKPCNEIWYIEVSADSCGHRNHCYMAPVPWEQVTSIDVLCRGENVPAGTRITVYGLRG